MATGNRASTPLNTGEWSRKSLYMGYEKELSFATMPCVGPCWSSMTSCSGCWTGSIRSSTWSINVKMAVLAPMPSASDRIATHAKTGLLRSVRTASRMSWISVPMLSFSCLHFSKPPAVPNPSIPCTTA